MQSTLKTITIVLFLMSSWTALNAQSTETKEKRTASQKALDCENCQKDRVEYLSIIAEKVVKIEAQQAKIDNYDGAIEAIKIKYLQLLDEYEAYQKSTKKGKFWIWLKGVGTGIVIGAVAVLVLLK